jgi:hypothetical protein
MSANKRENVKVNVTNFLMRYTGSFEMLLKNKGAAAILFA